jgi:ArsR family transcriptional regulator, arsenate/arsenite/antimonite-responsive transcriptional repressor
VADSDLTWEALADPTRRAILRVLAQHGELAAGAIAAEVTTVGRSAVSAQLRVLKSAGWVNDRRAGRNRLYMVQAGAADEIVRFISALYSDSLGALKRHVEAAATHSGTEHGGSATAG